MDMLYIHGSFSLILKELAVTHLVNDLAHYVGKLPVTYVVQ